MDPATLVQQVRRDTGLSVRALAEAAGVAASTVHRIEQGELQPTVETLRRITEAAGMRLDVQPRPDYSTSVFGLGRAIKLDLGSRDHSLAVHMAAELVGRFANAGRDSQSRMIAAEPKATGDPRWDAFLGALAEWLAVIADLPAPSWTRRPERYLPGGWWVTPMKSMYAWEYAGSPAAFQSHGVYLHRDSLTNV